MLTKQTPDLYDQVTLVFLLSSINTFFSYSCVIFTDFKRDFAYVKDIYMSKLASKQPD